MSEPTNSAQATAAPLPPSRSAQLVHAAGSFLSMIVIALFILTFLAQPFRIPSPSMEPTLLVGDFLLVSKVVRAPAGHFNPVFPAREVSHGDIIVFRYPPDPKIHVVKRVIGLPGDRVRLKDGVVYLNGEQQRESYVMPRDSQLDAYRDQFPAALYTDPAVDPRWWMQLRREVKNGEYTVPSDNYFVLGDNRTNSRDSRYWGLVPRKNVVGSAFLIYFSLRQAATGDVSSLPDDPDDPAGPNDPNNPNHPDDSNDKLDQRNGDRNPVTGFARWHRMFRIVR